MTIRRATTEEAKSIKLFDEFVGDRRIDNWRGELFAFFDGRDVVGYIAHSSNLFYNRPYIAFLCVKESHRRRGIARQLVQRVLAVFEDLDVWVSTEEGNQPAIALFRDLAFEQMGAIAGLNHDEEREVFFMFRPPGVQPLAGRPPH